ncbi:MAG TPA: UDP-N-acetylmuramoyl-L-alanyl-D-glutamate--2,6-diaminopimelate ligase [Thermoanaerobaculia bacterium]|nr:UDP-N-acetylmuramoyl-L-alanyl-D-glutamate--2,6-diaminopimelate ligase [Thermoanaerobaculia bacterium]
MKLGDLLRDVPVVSVRADRDANVHSVTADSRQVTTGSVFVAVQGFVVDGARFVDQAFEQGAACVVSEKPRQRDGGGWIEVQDARVALALLAANLHGRPAESLALIGVTGTSGKTTTTKMVESILDATGEPVGLIGTIEYRAGESREIADRTTPDPVVLQSWFARMVGAGVKRAVMEVSSHALALRRTHGVPFAAAVFTNLSRDHFDFHRDFDDYFAAKKMLFDQIDRSRRTAVVNVDDPYGRTLAAELGSAAMTFGRAGDADIRPAANFEVSIRGLRGKMITPAGEIEIDSPLLGWPNLSNWMGAIGAAIVTGVDTESIQKGIRNLQSVRGRFERVEVADGGTVVVDYAHKPDALEKLLRAVRDLAPERKIVVLFGCGGDRDAGKRPLMGEIAAKLADTTIITSDNPRGEDALVIIRQIEDGYRSTGRQDCLIVPDRRQAIERAVEMVSRDCVVVVAGKGHETYQVVGDQIIHFDDREEVELAGKKAVQK